MMKPTRNIGTLAHILLVCIGVLTSTAATVAFAELAPRSLRVGLPIMPETLDPARSDSAVATMVMAGIYDTLFALDPIARPAELVPLAAAELPGISADYRTITVRIRSGIFFTPHPSFGGKPRELVAADFAYSLKRLADPKIRSTVRYLIEGKIEGLDALAKQASDAGVRLDYDAPVSGLAVPDPRTLRIRLNAPDPYFPFLLSTALFAAVAREVVEAEGDTYGQRPVGTGAFVAEAFTPGQSLVLRRNPAFRELTGDDLLAPSSRATQTTHAIRGRRLPDLDRLTFSFTPEAATNLLALRRGELDMIYLNVPELATQNGKLKPDIARDGVQMVRDPAPLTLMRFFSSRDPVVGGDSRAKIALRRAIAMAFDDDEYIRVFDAGWSTVRHQVVPAGIEGFLPGYHNPNLFNPDAANALLDRFGYKRGKDGYRSNPDGSTLELTSLMTTSSTARRGAEFLKRMLDRVGLRVRFETLTMSERMKRMATCQFGMSVMDWVPDLPDGTNPLSMFWSKSIGTANMSCFADPVFDAAYEKALVTPPGPARTELFKTMQTRIDAMAPARPLPVGDHLLLKRRHVVGPFGTINDWLQVLTLGVDPTPR